MIPFNRPYATGAELANIQRAIENARLSGDGPFTSLCHRWIEEHTQCKKALLVHSGTAALELAALLTRAGPGDEVIMPSFTFVSTANAFVLRGATPVFVDIRPDTLNIDESLIEAAITEKTRAIAVVHYAGISCDMDAILRVAQRHNLLVVEDAAQGVASSYRGRPLGSIGQLGCLSFHETKNIVSGEGGALQINAEQFTLRAEIIREKGTNRSQFYRGQVDKYTWVDIGSSYLPSELIAAFLWAQLQEADRITAARMDIWTRYHNAFADAEAAGLLRRPIVPPECTHNAHMYYLLLPDLDVRTKFIQRMAAEGVQAVFHYVPLHSAPYGRSVGRSCGSLSVTDDASDRLVRLPLWPGLEERQDQVIEAALRAISG